MPTVKVISNGKYANDEISLNNGDLILIYKGTDIVNQLMVSSYKGSDCDCNHRLCCNLLQLKSGLSYKSSPLKRKTFRNEIRQYLFDDYTVYKNCYDFELIKNSNYIINIEVNK